jgi:hypothetical protein
VEHFRIVHDEESTHISRFAHLGYTLSLDEGFMRKKRCGGVRGTAVRVPGMKKQASRVSCSPGGLLCP